MRRLLPGLLLLVGAASGLTYWAVSGILRANEPLPVTILYRYGDTDYLALIYALSRFQLHEFVTTGLGNRLISFPPGLSMLYALPIAAFGDYGFAVADVLLSAARMAVCVLAARILFSGPRAVALGALTIFVITGPLPYVSRYWGLFYRPLWDLRYLRPYVTGVFSLALIVSTHYLSRALPDTRVPWRLCTIQGMLIGLAAQGDFHLGIIATFVSMVILAAALVRSPPLWRSTFASASAIAITCLLTMTSMLAPAISAAPDTLRRLGEVPISRLHPPLLGYLVKWPEAIALGVICLAVGYWRVGGVRMEGARRLLFVTYLFVVMAILATPLSVILLGRGIQMHHFPFRSWGFTILGLTIAALIAGSASLRPLLADRRRITAVLSAALAAGLLVVHFGYMGAEAARAAAVQTQQRVFPLRGLRPVAGYRRDLDDLWRELQGKRYQNADVLGTFDQQLGMLWLTRDRHHLWNPDPFLTTVDDGDIQTRVVAFAQLVQMTPQEFSAHVREGYFDVWVLGSDKWGGRDLFDDEVKGFEAAFAVPTSIDGALDIVILERAGNFATERGPGEGFSKSYENNTFSVWVKNSLLAADPPAGN